MSFAKKFISNGISLSILSSKLLHTLIEHLSRNIYTKFKFLIFFLSLWIPTRHNSCTDPIAKIFYNPANSVNVKIIISPWNLNHHSIQTLIKALNKHSIFSLKLIFYHCSKTKQNQTCLKTWALKLSKSSNRSLVEYEMKKAGIFKSKLALIMYTLASCVYSLYQISSRLLFFFSYAWICRKNRETKCEEGGSERKKDTKMIQ